MTLHVGNLEVGVRELHDRLSHYLGLVEKGTDVVVTKRGRRIAVLSAADREDPFEDLVRRGLIRPAQRPRHRVRASVKAKGSVSELVKDQRR